MTVEEHVREWNALLSLNGDALSGTPIYVYSGEIAVRNLEVLQAAVGNEVELLLSLKANPNLALNQFIVRNVGVGVDVSGLGELAIVAGLVDNARVVSLVGPGKSREVLSAAVGLPVGQIVLESGGEFTRLLEVASVSQVGSLLLRVNAKERVSGANEVMSGGASQFGIDEELVAGVIGNMRASGREPDGFHFFRGSQIRDTSLVVDSVRYAVEVAIRLSEENGLELRRLSVGGGIGIPHDGSHPEVQMAGLHKECSSIWSHLRNHHPDVQVQMEVGRFAYGTAGVFLTRVVEVKRSRGRTFAIVDSGVSSFSRPVVRWGEPHPIWKVGDPLSETTGSVGAELCDICGPTCLPGDMIGERVWLRQPSEGDVLAIGNAGAYGWSMSLHSWGSLPMCREVVV